MRTTDDFLGDYERLLHDAARARLAGRRRPRLRRGVARIAVPALAAVAVVLIARPSPDSPERAVPTPRAQASSFSALATLERRAIPERALGGLGRDRSRPRWDQARLALVRDGVSAYVVPGAKKTTCLLAIEDRAGSSLTCGDLAKAPRALIDLRVGVDDRTSVIVSLVPDGAATATVHEEGAAPATVAVTNNVLIAHAGHAPATMRWHDRTGVHVVRLAGSARWNDHTGPAGGGSIQARTAVPGKDGEVGVLAYRTKVGRVCLVAGPIQDGRVGQIGRTGFHALDPADAPGSCGQFSENFADFGGIALARSHVDDRDRPQGIVYGLLADASTVVRVTWSDGSTTFATATAVNDPQALQGAQAAFVAVAAPGVGPNSARVELMRPDGTPLHTFDL